MTAPIVFTSKSRDFAPKAIKVLLDEHQKKAAGEVKFLDEMAWWSSVKNYWTGDITAAIFWQEVPPKKPAGCTNWFGYYWAREYDQQFNIVGEPSLRIFGMPTFDPVIDAVFIPATNVIAYSRYQHDFFEAPGGVAVDGGREYFRIVGDPARYVKVKFNLLTKKFKKKGHWYATAG